MDFFTVYIRWKLSYYKGEVFSRKKKTMIVDVVIVNSKMGLKVWERGEGSQNQGVGSCYQTRDQSVWRFATMSKTSDFKGFS
jgi:hypothetical protein